MMFLEWAAVLIALFGSYLIGSQRQFVRQVGFWTFLVSNVLWIIWGGCSGAWGLMTMQMLFCITSARGIRTNRGDLK